MHTVETSYTGRHRPTPRPLPEAEAQTLSALLTRRRPLVPRLTAERRRLQTAPPPIRADIQAPITWLARRLARTDDDRAAAIRSSPLWRATDEMLQSTPGVGPMLSRTLGAEVPELGALNRQKLATLIGVAPFNGDRGTLRGTRAIWGGRMSGRCCT
jgi:transposase